MIPLLKSLSIEISSVCNLKCSFCIPHKQGSRVNEGRPPFMDFEFFKRVTRYTSNFGEIAPQFQGEPLLHPQFLEICHFLNESRKYFRFNSNGQLLTRKIVDELENMKYFLGVTFSIDAITKETFEKIRIGSDFNKIIENVNYSIPKVPCSVNFVLMEENEFELPAVVRYFTYRKVPVTASIVTDDDGLPTNYFWKPEERLPCLPQSAIILTDGSVVVCCRDHLYERIMGNLKEQSLAEIWFSEKYKYLWKMQEEGRWDELSLCSNCMTWCCETIKTGRTKKYIEGVIATYYPFWVHFWEERK